MSKTTVVIFTKNNARILVNPQNLENYLGKQDCLINPNLEDVKGISPEFWKLQNSHIVPMTEAEMFDRQEHINEFGVDNIIRLQTPKPRPKIEPFITFLSWSILSTLLAYSMYLILRN